MRTGAEYPTAEHEAASRAVTDSFSKVPDVEAVILTGSCARGKATEDSCLDIIVLLSQKMSLRKRSELDRWWSSFYENSSVFDRLPESRSVFACGFGFC